VSALIIDDELIHYEVLGRGRPVIFLHGWLGSWRYWIPTMQALSGDYRAYALDLWGFGDSAKVGERYPLDAQAEMLARFMEQLGILKAAFVGHGLGGAVVLRLARKHPDLADRAMAVGLPLRGSAVHQRLLNSPTASLTEWLLGRGPDIDPINREAAKADPLAVEGTVRAVMESELRGELADLRLPCLLVYGEKDPMIIPPEDTALDGLNGNVHSIGLEDSRHFPMLDEAAKFNRLLADFLSLPSGESLTNLGLKEEWRRRVR
jgi:pimeloyl-ACP methyl ester carboxylesterase